MEGLFFLIAMIIFIVRVMNKIKKAASGGKKPAVPLKSTPVKDKLQELIRNMEETERLRKEGIDTEKNKEFFNSDQDFDEDPFRKDESSSIQGDEYSDFTDKQSFYSEKYKTVFTGDESVKNDLQDNKEVPDSLAEYRSETSGDWDEQEKLKETFKKKGIKQSRTVVSEKGSVLSSIARYSELQKAVVYKEILDSPVSEKYGRSIL